MPITPEEAARVYREADPIYSAAQVESALERMAAAITERLARANPVVLCVMNGGLVPTGKILTLLDFPLQVDYLHATRYRGATQGGGLRWQRRPEVALAGRTVLVVDDILDEGVTLAAILDHCREAGAASVYAAVLLEKRHGRNLSGMEADFIGLPVVDRYVFGYGMDYKGYLRNAQGIFAVKGL
jgi:hypoxanthine phosphoribosyltransferase